MSSFVQNLNLLRAAGDETRLRMLLLLSAGELTVKELTRILAQSQPRVSRHLKILADAGLVTRYQEGAWVFYRLKRQIDGFDGLLADLRAIDPTDDPTLARDADQLAQLRAERASQAAAYFRQNADEWEELRKLHLPEADIEQAMRMIVGPKPVERFVDLGTGTGQMLILFEDLYAEGIGFDLSREMLAIARSRLEATGVAKAQARYGNLHDMPMLPGAADLVCLHQVLHFLSDPDDAVARAARLLAPGGRMLIVDFAPHQLEFLREAHAHRRLGFSQQDALSWSKLTGMSLIDRRKLAPDGADTDRLTVNLWLFEKPAPVDRGSERERKQYA